MRKTTNNLTEDWYPGRDFNAGTVSRNANHYFFSPSFSLNPPSQPTEKIHSCPSSYTAFYLSYYMPMWMFPFILTAVTIFIIITVKWATWSVHLFYISFKTLEPFALVFMLKQQPRDRKQNQILYKFISIICYNYTHARYFTYFPIPWLRLRPVWQLKGKTFLISI